MKIGNSPDGSAAPAKAEARPAARKPEASGANDIVRKSSTPEPSAQVAISATAQMAASAASGASPTSACSSPACSP